MEREIIYAKEVELFLDELLIILFKKGYFGFPNSAKTYVDRIFDYVEQNTGILPGHAAPPHFSKYAKNTSYIIYRANKSTVWYILYQRRDNVFLIRHITNNHVAAQYFG
jgi:hypothetical protein